MYLLKNKYKASLPEKGYSLKENSKRSLQEWKTRNVKCFNSIYHELAIYKYRKIRKNKVRVSNLPWLIAALLYFLLFIKPASCSSWHANAMRKLFLASLICTNGARAAARLVTATSRRWSCV